MTWEGYINFKLAVAAIGAVVALICFAVAAIVRWREDCHVNDEPDPNEPSAGKTLGL